MCTCSRAQTDATEKRCTAKRCRISTPVRNSQRSPRCFSNTAVAERVGVQRRVTSTSTSVQVATHAVRRETWTLSRCARSGSGGTLRLSGVTDRAGLAASRNQGPHREVVCTVSDLGFIRFNSVVRYVHRQATTALGHATCSDVQWKTDCSYSPRPRASCWATRTGGE